MKINVSNMNSWTPAEVSSVTSMSMMGMAVFPGSLVMWMAPFVSSTLVSLWKTAWMVSSFL